MKIVFLSNLFPPHVRGGYELGCQEIASHMQARGHEVSIVTSRTHGTLDQGRPRAALQVHEIFEPVFAFESPLGELLVDSAAWHRARTEALGGCHVSNALALHRHLSLEKPDLVWVFNPIGLGPVSILETLLTQPTRVLLLLMDDLDHFFGQSRRQLDWTPRLRRIKRRLAAISCSELTRRSNERLGCFGRHDVVPNGIDFDQWASPRSRAPRGTEPLRLVYVGQVEEPKGLLQLVRGLARLAALNPPVRCTLDIVGGGSSSFRERLDSTLGELRLTETVRCTGFCNREDLPARLAGYDAACFLLRDGEPFGYAPLEAAAAGLPVVLTRKTGVAECMPADYPFFVEDREDADAVAGVLCRLAASIRSLPEIAAATLSHLRANCDLTRAVLPRYEAIIEALPESPPCGDMDALLGAIRAYDNYEMYRTAQ